MQHFELRPYSFVNEALHHPNANVITRAVGSTPSLELDSVEGEIRAGDHFVLASDGLTRLLREDARLRLQGQ